MQCSSGSYSVSDMQDLMLAAGGASNHMFSPQQDGHQHHHHHLLHHHQQQQYQRSLQPQDMFELYHRQAGLQQEHHLSPPELQSSHIQFGLHHPQQKAHLSILHQMSLGSETSGELAISSLAAPRTASTTSHDHVITQYMKQLPTSGRPVTTLDSAVEEHSEVGADDAYKVTLSGNRWPQQETLALLQIRSEMDALFRDSVSKGSLWEDVSRKLYNVGYQRSAKKCKEKFENLNKYYKKTKDEKQEGRAYRFHTELESIYSASHEQEMEDAMLLPADGGSNASFPAVVAKSGTHNMEGDATLQVGQETSSGPKSSNSTSCGNAAEGGVEATEQQICGNKRKRSSWRSMRIFFDELAKQLMEKQDALHKKFLEVLERREEERVRKEEVYKRQEMARMRREQELRAHEQALAATRDAALVAFLQKVTGETLHLPEMTPSVADPGRGCNIGGEATTPSGDEPSDLKDGGLDANSRRWPKVEVLALIRVRTSLEPRFQEAGPKSQLWEEVSFSMSSLGFSRSGKRCKEKWENINKYYRKTKDNIGRKLRPESATKTCPYFHQLELLYERGILTSPNSNSGINKSTSKLDPPQTSGEFLESTSKDDSQQTSMNPDYQPGSSVSIMHVPANVQTTDDGRSSMVVARSGTGEGDPICNNIHAHDFNTRGDLLNSKIGPASLESDQINVNCHPAPHLSDIAYEQAHGHKEYTSNRVGAEVLNNEGINFVREMMEIQHQHHQQQQHQRLTAEHLFERHQLVANHNDHAARIEMQNAAEEQDLEMRMHQEEQMSKLDHERSHRDSATLMALVHKLASGDSHPSDFDLSSPASPE